MKVTRRLGDDIGSAGKATEVVEWIIGAKDLGDWTVKAWYDRSSSSDYKLNGEKRLV